jgi:hypothetical protein
MKAARWQFSLRQLLLLMTVVAIVAMLVSHQWRAVVGLATVAVWFLDAFFSGSQPAFESWLAR